MDGCTCGGGLEIERRGLGLEGVLEWVRGYDSG